MRESIIQVTIYPRLTVNNVNEDNDYYFIEFDYINHWAWGDIARIKKLEIIASDSNIAITEIIQPFNSMLYLIVKESHPLFNLNLFLQSDISYELDKDIVDNAYSELNDMLQSIIESYGIDLNKR